MDHLKDRLEKVLQPSERLINDIKKIEGDILILGVGGKIGPSLAKLALRAIKYAGVSKKVIGVSRFSDHKIKAQLEEYGVVTHVADLLDRKQLLNLPGAANIIYLAGTKFGTSGNESFTWAMNSYLPGMVAERFQESRIVAYSTGNVYPLTPIGMGGADEEVLPNPNGEYAQSCLGRERIFQYFSKKNATPVLIFRLNYANDLRYGVLLEIAKSVYNGQPVNIEMGQVNVIWQGDSNEMTLRSLLHCNSPAEILNVTGPEIASVKWLAEEFGKRFGKTPSFEGTEQPNALLSNSAKAYKWFGYPRMSLLSMIDLTAAWVLEGGETINKPTHFQEREGKY